MKIGVFVSKRQSFDGGGYTITEELLDTLINEINFKKININQPRVQATL